MTTEQTPPPFTARLDGIRVLIVEDNRDALEMISLLLQMVGAETTPALSVAEALEAIARQLPDILLSDINMPEEDGYDLIRKVRELPPDRGGQLPAIALTAMADEEDRAAALAAGFQAHLPKPVDPDVLVSVIQGLRAGRPTADE